MQEPIRIHTYLARLGLGSRREMEKLIREGKVELNRKPAKLGEKLRPGRDELRVRKRPVGHISSTEPVVLALHKPRGYITTMKDPMGRTTVYDLLPKKMRQRLFPIGRLDLMSEGLLLFTNDGELANQLMHPRYEVPRVYEVKIRGELDKRKRQWFEKGPTVGDRRYKPVEVLNLREVTKQGTPKFKVQLRLHEGKNHHVRRLFEAVRCHVLRLKRLSLASVHLKGIPRGGYRYLSKGQITRLKNSLGQEGASTKGSVK